MRQRASAIWKTLKVGFLGSERVDGRLTLPESVKVLVQKAAA